ncbi:MAG: anti-sigma factor family protein [Planctomycetota bacterium]
MNCREANVFISLHVGDDLPEEQVGILEEHLESCALCEAEYESYAASRDALLSIREDFLALPGHDGQPGASLWDDISQAIEPSTSRRAAGGGGSLLRWHQHPLMRGGLAAAVLALFSAPLWLDWGGGATGQSGSGLEQFRPILAGVDLAGDAEDRGLEGQPIRQMEIDGITPATESVSPEELQDFLQLNNGRGLLRGNDSLDPATIAVPVKNSPGGSY